MPRKRQRHNYPEYTLNQNLLSIYTIGYVNLHNIISNNYDSNGKIKQLPSKQNIQSNQLNNSTQILNETE